MAKIETFAIPHRLYRYRNISVDPENGKERLLRELDAIENKYIYCAPWNSLNDPMEGTHRLSAYFRTDAGERMKAKKIIDARDRLGIVSLSEIATHEPLWAYYANQFKGICIAFDLNKLMDELADEVSFVRMNYSETPPIVRIRNKSRTVEDEARMTVSTKTWRWGTEREWRIINPKHGRLSYNSIECVAEVLLGSRIENAHADAIRSKLDPLKIKIKKMNIDKYAIEFEA